MTINETPAKSTIPVWAVREWQTAYLRVKGTAPALRLWYQVLTPTEQKRLGGEVDAAYEKYGSAVRMWQQLRGGSVPQTVITVAIKIGVLDARLGQNLLIALGEETDDPETAVEMAVAKGGLVLVEIPREAFWMGERLDIEWGQRRPSWDLLWELARASKLGETTDEYTFRGGSSKDPRYLTKLKHRLVNLKGFPQTLEDLVVSAGRGTYRLDLLPEKIRIFERSQSPQVREWIP